MIFSTHASGSGIREITTEEDLQGVIKASPLVAIDFYASWCGPCQMIGVPSGSTFFPSLLNSRQ